MRLRVQVLGTVGVVLDDRPTPITSPSQRTVLGLLAARAGSVVATDLLVDAVWPESPPRTATTSLRTYVSRLRRVVGDAIEGTAGGYRLEVSEEELDLLDFERLLDDAAGAPPEGALASLDEALALWRGPPFGDVGDVEAIRPVVARLEERCVSAREERAAVLLSLGRANEAVAAAEELVTDQPLRERAWAVLVDGLTATARPTEGLRAYQRAVEVLAEAGLSPTAELRRAEAAALVDERPVPAPRRLTRPRSSLIGRERERAELGRLVTERPVVTLVGPGGVGKTRLARTVAADVETRFGWGVRLVELAGVDEPGRVADAIAGDLGLTVGPEGPMAALESAGDLDLLVVVDNCEHVVDAAAEAVACLVGGGSWVRVLATSREPLAIDGEQRWPVEPLPIAGDAGAVRLFVERARSVRPDFDPDADDLHVIAGVVEALDGLPLAVEMAAAALRSMPLGELAARLASELVLPALPRRDIEDRHRTLDALVEWSGRLLDEEERAVFSVAAVFAGSVTAEDVAEVSGHPAPFEVLCRLADRSLIVADTSSDHTRFRMLRTIRQHALAESTHEASALRRRHASWLTAAVTAADSQLRGADERAGHERMEALLDDARAVVSWALDHDLGTAAQLTGRLYLFAQTRLRDEVLGWAADVVDRIGHDTSDARSQLALTAAAQRAVNVGDLERARELAQRATDLGPTPDEALALEVLSDVQLFSGELERARATARIGFDAAARAGDPHGMASSFANLVLASAYDGDHTTAETDMQLAAVVEPTAPSDRAWLRYVEGERLLDRDPGRALPALDDAIAIADAAGNRYLAALARTSSATLRARTGDPVAATGPFSELLGHWRGQGDRTHLLTTLRNLVVLLHRLDRPDQAAELLGTVLGTGVAPTFGAERRMLEEVLDRVGQELGAEDVERRLTAGRARSVDDAALLAQRWLDGGGL